MTPEQEKPLAVTATEAAMRRYRISRAVSDLLHSLKRWVVAYPMRQSDILPDHNVAWVTEHDGGPGRVIEAAIKANPALWLHALPACGHRWMQTDQQRAAERKAQAAYDKMCEEWDRNPPEPPLTLQPTGDDIPF